MTMMNAKFVHSVLRRLNQPKQLHKKYKSDCQAVKHDPLKNIRVLDLTRILAGPFCTMMLGDLGAEIIKIENPDGGDEARHWGPPFIGTESAYFTSINRNKKSVAINLKSEEGKQLCYELAKKCDVLVENFIPGKLDKLGFGYNDLKKIAPHLIYCSISGYGASGPYSTRPGYDVIAASIGGLMNITGTENGDPNKVGVAVTDLATGLYAHGAIMAALLQRQTTNLGQKIDCNLLSTQIALLVNISSNYLNANQEGRRLGTGHESIVPYQSFKTADGYFTAGGLSNSQFVQLCKVLELDHVASEDKFHDNKDRVRNRVELIGTLSKRFAQKTNAEWLQVFEGSGLPYGPINNMKETFSDPQVIHSGIVQEMAHPTAGTIRVTGPPVEYSDSTNAIRLPPPLLGQHTYQVLYKDLNVVTKKQLQKLHQKNIVRICDSID